jgi:hypothetical protein
MEDAIEMVWYTTTTWDYYGIGKINVNYIVK